LEGFARPNALALQQLLQQAADGQALERSPSKLSLWLLHFRADDATL
jgi:hypothetical protein